jgi:hypothetical protein
MNKGRTEARSMRNKEEVRQAPNKTKKETAIPAHRKSLKKIFLSAYIS